MSTSLIYRSSLLYEMLMFGLYGRHYFSRNEAIAELIPHGASVLDVCCGPARLYRRYLRPKNVDYMGLDLNPRFIARLVRAGAKGQVWNLNEGNPLPPADYVLMQASLYHFLPDADRVVDQLLTASRKHVIIAEPVRNLADSKNPIFALLAKRNTDPGSGTQVHRFTEKTLDELFARYADRVERSFLIPGGREKVYVLSV